MPVRATAQGSRAAGAPVVWPRLLICAGAMLVALMGAAFAQEPAATIIPEPTTATGAPYSYMVYLPSTYNTDPATTYYPLIFCMDGLGQAGNGSSDGTLTPSSTNQLAYVLQLGPLALINNGAPASTYFAGKPAIIVQPQTSSDWGASALNTLINQIAGATQGAGAFRVDLNRIYMLGLSEGGEGAWSYGEAYGSRLAVLVVMAGAMEPSYPTSYTVSNAFSNLTNTIVWGLHDDQDPTVRPTWTVGQRTGVAPLNFAGWVGGIAEAAVAANVPQRCLDTHPDQPTVILGGVNNSEPVGLSGVTTTRSGHFTPGSGWSWVDGDIFYPGSKVQVTLFKSAQHDGWDQTFGTGSTPNTTFWNWLLGQSRSNTTISGSDNSVQISVAIASVAVGQSLQLSASARNASGAAITPQPPITWTISGGSGGSISSSGLFTASAASGFVTATATMTIGSTSYRGSVALTLTPAVFSTVAVGPATVTLSSGHTQQFTATAYDSAGNALAPQPAFTWSSVGSGGSVSSGGLFSATGSSGSVTVTATATVSSVTNHGSGTVTLSAGVAPTQTAAPVFTAPSGPFNGSQAVAITCPTNGAAIFYTTDSSTPTASSTRYSAVFSISATTDVKAIAIASGDTSSAVTSATYTLLPASGSAVTSTSSGGGGGGGCGLGSGIATLWLGLVLLAYIRLR